MNKKRILQLIDIMKNETDMDHPLSLKEIVTELEKRDVIVNNRKTLYDDFRYLNENGYDVEYSDGKYYLEEAPFSLSEIKIIIDSVNSLRSIDDRFLASLKDKIYSFASRYQTDYLKELEYAGKHVQGRFINRLEDCLEAIKNDLAVIIRRKKHDDEKICPIFLYRENDYYYLYYHYPDDGRIYHARFDNIESIILTDEKDALTVGKDRVISMINESTKSFHSRKTSLISFEIMNDSPQLRGRLEDDFPNLVYTKKGFSIKAGLSSAFFARIAGYSTDIRIEDRDIAEQYERYLEDIIHNSRNRKDS